MVPSGSVEPEPSKLTGEPAVPLYGPLGSDVGGWLTGGGSIVALCPERVDDVRQALQRAGFQTIVPGEPE